MLRSGDAELNQAKVVAKHGDLDSYDEGLTPNPIASTMIADESVDF